VLVGCEGNESFSPPLRVHNAGSRKRTDNPPIIVTENGCCMPGEDDPSKTEEELLRDEWRVDYYKQYISAAQQAAMEDGVNLRGYFAWTLVDNFEWADGYAPRFGIIRVNFTTLERRGKSSARLLSDIIKSNGIDEQILAREY
jgi:beta-glucosidase/6-phospho-beta-glucosidase/beta-galactosidase